MKKMLLSFAIVSVLLFSSCVRKEDDKEPVLDRKTARELSNTAIDYLKKTPTIVEACARLKHQGVAYREIPWELSRFSFIAEREKLVMRFGMLSAAMAYEKILGEKTQLTEITGLYAKYVKELNVDPVVTSTYERYMKKIEGKEIDSLFLEEIASDLKKDQTSLIDHLKEADEEFLFYYFFGMLVEVSYIKTFITDGKTFAPGSELPEATKKSENMKYIREIYTSKKYGKYAQMYRPVVEIFMHSDEYTKMDPAAKKELISKTIKDLREEILN